ncbi:hypothetical protein [Motilibacter aurantiacus]|uniref:hypothetical protein n=1 Tax=Motilibacter aurantiacus TaxID=2714955 RepID=UPI00140D18D3|nr:hypothetical protein [Motilibacter aurantiacus]NHC47656.1 hypothetical protein [Motilibacter aurantiacus]
MNKKQPTSRIAVVACVFSVVAVGVVGALEPDEIRGHFENSAAWWSFVVAVATLVVTAAIPVLLYHLTSASARAAVALQEQQKDLLSRQGQILAAQRADQLVLQAKSLTGEADLAEVLAEAEKLESAVSRLRVQESYWSNPAVPVAGWGRHRLNSGLAVRVSALNLAPKLEGKPTSQGLDELETLAKAAALQNMRVTEPITQWMMRRFRDGRGAGDTRIRDLLRDAGDDELFSSLLGAIDDMGLPPVARVHVVAGVSDAYLDRIGYYPRGERPTTELASPDLSRQLLAGMASLLHRRRLNGLAGWDGDEFTISPDGAAVVVAASCAAASYTDEHLAMRCVQNISQMGFPSRSMGLYDLDLNYARRKFREHQEKLFAAYPF